MEGERGEGRRRMSTCAGRHDRPRTRPGRRQESIRTAGGRTDGRPCARWSWPPAAAAFRLSTATGSDEPAMKAEMEILAKRTARARAWRDVPDRHVCALARDAENTLQRSVCAEATTLVGVAVDSWKCHYQHHRLLRPQLSAT